MDKGLCHMLNLKDDYQRLSRRYGKPHAVILTSVSLTCMILGIVNLILCFTIEFNLWVIILLCILVFLNVFYLIYLSILKWHLKQKISFLS